MFSLPQKRLDQVPGTPFFHTPNDAADPQDCDRYPNSPWCGSNPIVPTALGKFVNIVHDDCYTGIAITPVLGFISLPTYQILYRNPNCTPPPEINFNYDDSPWVPPETATGIYIWVSEGEAYFEEVFNNQEQKTTSHSIWNYQKLDAYYPNGSDYPDYFRGTIGLKIYRSNQRYFSYSESNPNPIIQDYVASTYFVNQDQNPVLSTDRKGDNFLSYRCCYDGPGPSVVVTFGYRRTVMFSRSQDGKNLDQQFDIQRGYGDYQKGFARRNWTITELDGNFKFIPPPEPRKIKEPMNCCPNNDQLLRLILQRIGNLPEQVPASYLTKNGKQPTVTKTISSLTELIAWQSERLDEVLGEYEIAIEIEDTDLAKEGNQSQTIRLPNLAEAIAEMFTLLIQTNINNELLINMMTRTLIETGQVKQSEFKTYSAVMAIVEYMGFHTNQTNEKMPLSFTPGAVRFDKFLKETEQQVGIIDYQEKETLTSIMQSLLQAAAITRAAHFRPLSTDKDTGHAQMVGDLIKMIGNTNDLKKQVEDYIKYIKKTSDGYIS